MVLDSNPPLTHTHRSAPLNGHPQAPRPGRAEKPPARSGTVKPYFDYSQSTNGDGATIPPPAPNHILEICNIAASIKPEEPGDAFSEIKVHILFIYFKY